MSHLDPIGLTIGLSYPVVCIFMAAGLLRLREPGDRAGNEALTVTAGLFFAYAAAFFLDVYLLA